MSTGFHKRVMDVPYVDLVSQHAAIKAELLEAVAGVIDRAQFILGPEVAEFERDFAALVGSPFAVAVNSGTDALALALRAAGVGPGDEVITVPNSFIASVSCIMMAGARPVLVDVRDDFTIDPDGIEAAVSGRTKAILPVHLTGRPCAMGPIADIAAARRLSIVEDCAQAVLADYTGRPVGSFGLGCFSLHPLKTLSACGDGGVITCQDGAVAARLKELRNHGLRTRDDAAAWAGNSRLDTVQAAMLLVKLRYVRAWTDRRREHARAYRRLLAGIEQVRVPDDSAAATAVYHTFVIEADDRDALRAFLAEGGVGTAVHYPVPIHLTTIGRELGYREGSFPVAERQARRILSLPVHTELTYAQIERVCHTIRSFYARSGS